MEKELDFLKFCFIKKIYLLVLIGLIFLYVYDTCRSYLVLIIFPGLIEQHILVSIILKTKTFHKFN